MRICFVRLPVDKGTIRTTSHSLKTRGKQPTFEATAFTTELANVRFEGGVNGAMFGEIGAEAKRLSADLADERLLAVEHGRVLPEKSLGGEYFMALDALRRRHHRRRQLFGSDCHQTRPLGHRRCKTTITSCRLTRARTTPAVYCTYASVYGIVQSHRTGPPPTHRKGRTEFRRRRSYSPSIIQSSFDRTVVVQCPTTQTSNRRHHFIVLGRWEIREWRTELAFTLRAIVQAVQFGVRTTQIRLRRTEEEKQTAA